MTELPCGAACSESAQSTSLPAARRVRLGLGSRGLLLRLSHRVVELFGVQPGVVERVAATPVWQREFGGHPDVLFRDGVRCAAPRGVRDGGARHHQIGPHPVDVESRAQRRDAP